MTDYTSRLANQVEQYRHVENIHDLPDIFHYWSNKFIRPIIERLFSVDSIPAFFGAPFLAAARAGKSRQAKFVSIGAGDCSLEISVAEWLVAHGLTSFTIECHELSPHLLERAARAVKSKRLEKHIVPVESDLNKVAFTRRYDGAMAHHSLHHLVGLEHVFGQVKSSLAPWGVFAISDMIGRNGHMRWPEMLDLVHALWRLLPESKRYNHQGKRLEVEYINNDCSTEGFEGIRAQDILPLLLGSFRPRTFLGYGGLTDIFVERAFGHNFSKDAAWDRDFIDLAQMLNERLIDGSIVKPTTMLALFDLRAPECSYYRNWSPGFCIRPVETTA